MDNRDKQTYSSDQIHSPDRTSETVSEISNTYLSENCSGQEEKENHTHTGDSNYEVCTRESNDILVRYSTEHISQIELANDEAGPKNESKFISIKKCSVLLNRCDEKICKSTLVDKRKSRAQNTFTQNVELGDPQQKLENYFKRRLLNTNVSLKMGPECEGEYGPTDKNGKRMSSNECCIYNKDDKKICDNLLKNVCETYKHKERSVLRNTKSDYEMNTVTVKEQRQKSKNKLNCDTKFSGTATVTKLSSERIPQLKEVARQGNEKEISLSEGYIYNHVKKMIQDELLMNVCETSKHEECSIPKHSKSDDQMNTIILKEHRKNKNKLNFDTNLSGRSNVSKNSSKRVPHQKVAARRSTRKLCRQLSDKESVEDPEITEITPVDPLAQDTQLSDLHNNKTTGKTGNTKNNTIVVNNTEQLLQIASGKGVKRKKEPTLVIIDTNSILSGKGPVPISQISLSSPMSQVPMVTGYSVAPVQGSRSIAISGSAKHPPRQSLNKFSPSDKSLLSSPEICSLASSDMYLIEAPSFIAPYLYKSPPKKSLKKYIEQLQEESERCTYIQAYAADNNNFQNVMNNKCEGNKSEEDDTKKRKLNEEAQPDAHCIKNIKENNSRNTIECEAKGNGIIDIKTNNSTILCDESSQNNKSCASDTQVKEKGKGEKKSDKYDQEYFNSSIGMFFIQIGLSLVKEYVYKNPSNDFNDYQIKSTDKNKNLSLPTNKFELNLNYNIEDNEPFHFEQKKCAYCNFQTESSLVMAHHLEIPHMFNNVYKCNFCKVVIENRSRIVYHMVMVHDMRVLLECAPAQHQCPNCPFEDNSKAKVNCHMVSCSRKYKPDRNQEPPSNWEPPAKIRHLSHASALKRSKGTSLYQMSSKGVRQLLPKLPSSSMIYNAGSSIGQTDVIVASRDQVDINLYNSTSKQASMRAVWQAPNLSITPLPTLQAATNSGNITAKQNLPGNSLSLLNKTQKWNSCEICDFHFVSFGDLQIHLRNYHQVKFSKKASYSTPSLGCQKCPLRFFTDQGLERHLLGTHGLVTASIQESAKNEIDGGHCPICSKLFQWKLLEHMNKEHKMSLKPVNISYKCTLCKTVTFEKYKQFEDHVFAEHSLPKTKKTSLVQPKANDVLKSLKNNNEITIISHGKQCHQSNIKTTATKQSKITEKNVKIQQKIKCGVNERKDVSPKDDFTHCTSSDKGDIELLCEVDPHTDKDISEVKEYSSAAQLKSNSVSECSCEEYVLSEKLSENNLSDHLITNSPNNFLSQNENSSVIDCEEEHSRSVSLSTELSYENAVQERIDVCSEGAKKSIDQALTLKSQKQQKCEHENNEDFSNYKEEICDLKENCSVNSNETQDNYSNASVFEDIKKNDKTDVDDASSISKPKVSDELFDQQIESVTFSFAKKTENQYIVSKNLNQQHVELINLEDSPVKEKNSEEVKNDTAETFLMKGDGEKGTFCKDDSSNSDGNGQTEETFENVKQQKLKENTVLNIDFLQFSPLHAIDKEGKVFKEYKSIIPTSDIEVIQLDNSTEEK